MRHSEILSNEERSTVARSQPRAFSLRFTLRSLLILGFVCCLLFGWVGRNLYRVRQEQAAVEALKQAGGTYHTQPVGIGVKEENPFDGYDPLARLLGRAERPQLNRVSFMSQDAGDPKAGAALAALKTFPEVESVGIRGPAFDDASIEALADLPRLQHFTFNGTRLRGPGIARLSKSGTIRSVGTQGTETTTELIEAIATLPKLETLGLGETKPIEPLSFESLERATGLKHLLLVSCGVDDEDAHAIGKLENLEMLHLDGITDAGLEQLAPLKKLRKLHLRHPITAEAARRFSASHPTCQVELGGKTYLAGEITP